MIIAKFISQNRRDFRAVYQCEGCGHSQESSGYDDRNFHDNVVPALLCPQCNESTNSLGLKPAQVETRYQEWEHI